MIRRPSFPCPRCALQKEKRGNSFMRTLRIFSAAWISISSMVLPRSSTSAILSSSPCCVCSSLSFSSSVICWFFFSNSLCSSSIFCLCTATICCQGIPTSNETVDHHHTIHHIVHHNHPDHTIHHHTIHHPASFTSLPRIC